MREICGILLAAGGSVRFGRNKLLEPLEDGTRLGLAAAQTLYSVLPHSIAVLCPDELVLAQPLHDVGLGVVINPDAALGMAHSLASGVAAARTADGWVVALADMPFIRPDTVRRVVDELERGAMIAAPSYGGQRGHPVGFARALREELLDLRGDQGAREVLERHKNELVTFEVDDPGILIDIDTQEDLVAALT